MLVEILKKRARNKAAKAKASSGKRKDQSQGWSAEEREVERQQREVVGEGNVPKRRE